MTLARAWQALQPPFVNKYRFCPKSSHNNKGEKRERGKTCAEKQKHVGIRGQDRPRITRRGWLVKDFKLQLSRRGEEAPGSALLSHLLCVPVLWESILPACLLLIIIICAQYPAQRLITHRVYDKAEQLFLETGTLVFSSPRGYAAVCSLHHSLVNVPIFSSPFSSVPEGNLLQQATAMGKY